MRKDAAIPDTRPALEALAASTQAWVVAFVALIIEAFADWGFRGPLTRGLFNACLRDALHDFKAAVMLRALARIRPEVDLWRAPAPCGFRQRRLRRTPIRFFARGVFNTMPRGFSARLAHLRTMLDDIEIWVERMKRRLLRAMSWDACIVAAPPIMPVARAAPPLIAAYADTS